VQPRFSDGTKVRIKIGIVERQFLYNDLEKYENRSGVVLNSEAVVAFFRQPTPIVEQSYSGLPITLYLYTVELEEGITIHDLTEYYLEEI
jgi:hypothetical protein